jgi:hypothetical protein
VASFWVLLFLVGPAYIRYADTQLRKRRIAAAWKAFHRVAVRAGIQTPTGGDEGRDLPELTWRDRAAMLLRLEARGRMRLATVAEARPVRAITGALTVTSMPSQGLNVVALDERNAETGDAGFDANFYIRTSSPRAVSAVLSPRVRFLLATVGAAAPVVLVVDARGVRLTWERAESDVKLLRAAIQLVRSAAHRATARSAYR